MGEQRDDDSVEQLLSGVGDNDDLVRLLGAIRASFDAIDDPEPSPEILAFIDSASTAGGMASPGDELSVARGRRRGFAVVAATGTTLGKLMIGVSAAAASVAGIQATGLVDIPILPDRSEPSESVATDHTSAVPQAVPPATASNERTGPVDDTYRFDVVDAGSVNIGVTNAEVVSAIANVQPDWKSEVTTTVATADVTFSRSGGTVAVHAQLDGDVLHVVISDDRTGVTEEFWLGGDRNPTLPNQAPTPQSQTSVTPVPERSGDDGKSDDDRSDHESDDEDKSGDDRSGDDERSDDDRAGDDDRSGDDRSDDDRSGDDDRSDDDRSGDDDRSDNDDDDSDRADVAHDEFRNGRSDNGRSDDGDADDGEAGHDQSDDRRSDGGTSDDRESDDRESNGEKSD